ncbi:MAG TPA: transketolase C-terminal domain-containing protein [Oculatellaceae cyanobacterium]
MRGAFARTLTELAAADQRIYLLTGDLGYMALEPFAEKFPERFINVGVAEQNMVGIATGLAEAGFLPFVYSIVTFACLRPYEFIRNGPCLHHLPVRVVGVGGGMEYGHNGASHYGLEDVAVMRVQPGMTVIAPADHQQTANALRQTYDLKGPVYYRLGKDDRVTVPGLDGKFELARTESLGSGTDVAIVAMGGITAEAARAAEILNADGIKARVVIVSSFNPGPDEDLKAHLTSCRNVISLEAHYAVGGLSSYVAEVIAENNLNCRFKRCAVEKQPDGITGGQQFLYERYGLAAQQVADCARTMMSGVLV